MTKLQIFQTESRRESLNVIKFSLQSRHMPLRQQVHGGDFLTDSRKLLQQYVVGGSPSQGGLAEKRKECRKTCSLDNPSDMLGTRLSDSLHQTVYCGQQGEDLQSVALSVPKLWGRLAHRQYLFGKGHEPDCTNSYNSSVRAG